MKYKFVLLGSASFYVLDPVRKETLGHTGQISHVKRGVTIDNMPITTVISDSTFDTDGKIPVLFLYFHLIKHVVSLKNVRLERHIPINLKIPSAFMN